MTTEAIFFDLDDTLLADEATSRAVYLAVSAIAQEQRSVASEALAAAAARHAQQLWRAGPAYAYCHNIGVSAAEGQWARLLGDDPHIRLLREWAPDYRGQVWRAALAELGVVDDALASGLAEAFQRERRARQIVYPDVEPVLRILGEHYTLGLITNGIPDLQREKIELSGLKRFFPIIVVSGEVGVGKPEPLVFRWALTQARVEPAAALMVGDNFRRDIAGAARLGMRGVWIVRAGVERVAEEAAPHTRITTLDELPALLA